MYIPQLRGSLSSTDAVAAAREIESFLLHGGRTWQRLVDGLKPLPLSSDWIVRSAGSRYGAMATRDAPWRMLHTFQQPVVEMEWRDEGYDLAELMALLERLPFEVFQVHRPVLSMDSPWRDVPSVPLLEHSGDLGWAVFFKGAGHDRLASRRWLEHGPWLLRRGANDLSMLQLCDLDASPRDQVAQAAAGRALFDRMAPGSIYRPAFPPPDPPGERPRRWRLPGEYDPVRQQWRGPVDDLSWRQIGRLLTWKAQHHHDSIEPVRSFALEVEDEGLAMRHLHDLWLCGMELWLRQDGRLVRLDEDYRPEPQPPDWVCEVRAREALEG